MVLLVTSARHNYSCGCGAATDGRVWRLWQSITPSQYTTNDSSWTNHNTTHHTRQGCGRATNGCLSSQWQFINYPSQHITPGKAVAEQEMAVFEPSISPVTHHNTTHTGQGLVPRSHHGTLPIQHGCKWSMITINMKIQPTTTKAHCRIPLLRLSDCNTDYTCWH